MKGIILAGGTGSRLLPLTKSTNKHLLPIFDKPMIYYPIQILKEAGITEIMVVTGINHAGAVFSLLGSGKEFGVKFTYRVQDEAGGLPHAIALAEEFVGTEKFVSINGDNIVSDSIKEYVQAFANGKEESRILLYETTPEEASKAGVAIMQGEKVTGFIEKPKNPPSNWISIGIYMYSHGVFDVIRTLKPSARGELEITDLHNYYLNKGSLASSKIKGHWLDAGTIDELARANQEVRHWQISKGMTLHSK